MESKIYDVIIVGGGPAGLTAALYSSRNGLKTAVIAKEIGGTANSILHIENWPGFSGTGAELMKTIYKQLENYKIDFFNEEVREILKKEKEFVAKTKNRDFLGKSIIIATGTERKRLNIPGEKEFIGKGISYCVTCDGFFFKNKIVGVIGGGDCAISSALALSEITKEVHVFYRGNEIECEITNFEKIRKKNNVKIHYNAIPIKFNGKEKLESLDVNENGNKKTYFIEGVFIEIGSVPLTDLIKKLKIELDKENQIIVDENMNTSVKGVFAAGDVTSHKLKQVIVAAGQGAIAAKSAYDYL